MSETDVDTLLEKYGLPIWGTLMEKLVRLRRNHLLPSGIPAEENEPKPMKRMGRPPKVRD